MEPFPPSDVSEWIVDESFHTPFLARLVVSLIRSGLKDIVPGLIDYLLEREVLPDEENCFLEVGRAYQLTDCAQLGIKYMELLLQIDAFKFNPDAWFLFGIFQQVVIIEGINTCTYGSSAFSLLLFLIFC